MTWWQEHLKNQAHPTQWRTAYEHFAKLSLSIAYAETIASACEKPAQLTLMSTLLADDASEPEPSNERARLFLSIVDETTPSLSEWLGALETLYNWLTARQRETTFGLALGYIHCCCEAVASGAPYANLVHAVEDMLETYGFDGTDRA